MEKQGTDTARALSATVLGPGETATELTQPIRPRRVPALAIVYGLTFGALALATLVCVSRGVDIAFVLRDPITTMKGHPLTGVLSNLGVLVWCASAGICFATRAILPRNEGTDEMRSFLLWSGMISSVLLIDDFFLIHDDLAYNYLGINEKLVFLAYGLVTAWYLFGFRRVILDSEPGLMFTALSFFTLSMLVDTFQSRWESPWRILFEDGFKLLGIVSWSAYLIRIGVRSASPTARQGSARV